jgi:peptide-methionine (S)-S-oxide reductase
MEQKRIAEAKISELGANQVFANPIVTELAPLTEFHKAEEYHQGYFRGHSEQPYCQYVVSPKVAKFRKEFAKKLRS